MKRNYGDLQGLNKEYHYLKIYGEAQVLLWRRVESTVPQWRKFAGYL
jgi:bisphosphoglycerate-dependent phosphoglycerate mutase